MPARADTVNQAALDGLKAMRALNLITLGDFSAAHDVEGKTWVGGNINASSSFTAGLGSSANPGQSAGTSVYATVTVVGAITGGGTVNLNDGVSGGGTAGTGHYGAIVGGDSNKINFNANGATVKIGGSMSGDVNFGSGGDISIRGFLNSIATGDGTTIAVGSTNKVQAGNASHVEVATGNVSGDVNIGSGSSVRTGGAVGGLTMGANSTASISGNVGPNLNLGANDQVVIGGTYLSQNVNGLPNGTTVTVNGSKQTQNSVPSGWTFNAGVSIIAPSTPPTIDLSADKTLMIANLQALSSQLNGLSQTTITDLTTPLVVSGSFGVFSMTEAQFETQNLNFDTLFTGIGIDKTIVINVAGSNLVEAGGANNNMISLSQNIIWNFAGATSLSVKNWSGSILAPNATVSNSNAINGSVVAQLFHQGGEVHLGTFNGDMVPLVTVPGPPPGDVPEPASWMMMLLGFGIAGSILRRRRAMPDLAAA